MMQPNRTIELLEEKIELREELQTEINRLTTLNSILERQLEQISNSQTIAVHEHHVDKRIHKAILPNLKSEAE